jgi:hypothetical protein
LKELGLTVEYHKVFVDDVWARAVTSCRSASQPDAGQRKIDDGGVDYRVGVKLRATGRWSISSAG